MNDATGRYICCRNSNTTERVGRELQREIVAIGWTITVTLLGFTCVGLFVFYTI